MSGWSDFPTLKLPPRSFLLGCLLGSILLAQEPTAPPATASRRVTGAITAIGQGAHTVTVTEDKTGTIFSIELQNTKSLRKVDPSTMDLKTATRITAEDLRVGDRVQVFASPAEGNPRGNPGALAAHNLILMSARDLESIHHEQAAAWQHSTAGVVTSVDAGGGKFVISARTPTGPKPVTVDVAQAAFTRYSLANPNTPASSKLGDIQAGDQVRILGEMSADGSTITARSVYSSPVRMLLGAVSAVSADAKQITVKDLQTKQSVVIALHEESAVRKLPAPLAYGLARRLNPDFKPAAGPDSGAAVGTAPARASGGAGGGSEPGNGMRSRDLSQVLDRVPKISAAELKPGDALLITGIPDGNDHSRFAAMNVIAGVEPIFQSASPRQMQSLGDWGTSLGGGGQDGGASPQ